VNEEWSEREKDKKGGPPCRWAGTSISPVDAPIRSILYLKAKKEEENYSRKLALPVPKRAGRMNTFLMAPA
jgi:hypothetical protein